MEIANVGSESVIIDGCSLVTFKGVPERSVERATLLLSGTLESGETRKLELSGAPTRRGGFGLYDLYPPPGDRTLSTDLDEYETTGLVYLDTNTAFAVSHLSKPEHNAIYECIYGGFGTGPYSRPFAPLGECLTNSPPIANAGPYQSVFVNDIVTLDGSASSDVDGDPLTFSWSINSKPDGSAAALSDETAVMPTFLVDRAGTYVVHLVVGDGIVSSTTDIVIASTENSPPVAKAGPDQAAFVNESITLDGGDSFDVDGDSLTFQWAFTSKPVDSLATLSDSTSVMPTFTIDKAGNYTIQLIVHDGMVNSPADSVSINIGNIPPIADAGPDQSAFFGDTIFLDGTNSSDADGDLLTYSWSITSQPIGSSASLSNSTASNPTFPVDTAGTYVVQLIVNDGQENSEPDTMMVSTDNTAPVADAGEDQSVLVGDTVTLNGSQSKDVDTDPLTFNWSFVSIPDSSAAELSDSTAEMPTFAADAAGTYAVQLFVNDGSLNSPTDSVVVITVNRPPTADAGPDQDPLVNDIVNLDGSNSSDPDSDMLTYSWAFLSQPANSTASLDDASLQRFVKFITI